MREITISIISIGLLMIPLSCHNTTEPEAIDEATWKLGWRMLESSWAENFPLAESQFDSLLSSNKPLNERFLITGLETKMALAKEDEVLNIIKTQPEKILREICHQQFAASLQPCLDLHEEHVENKELQYEIISIFVDDQAIRNNIMHDLIAKHKIDTIGIKTKRDLINHNEINIDEVNKNRLKEIFKEHGFPTRKQIGKDAMRGIFLIIQHADGDKEWQAAQLPIIERAIKSGDFKKPNYAFLYDRIKVNNGEPQRYGSQFERVDRVNKIAIQRETEDVANLDQRRREMEMMPIETYKRLLLRDRNN